MHDPDSNPTDRLAELMYVRCSNCGSWMDVKPGQISGVTHSICPACLKKELRKLDREDRRTGAA